MNKYEVICSTQYHFTVHVEAENADDAEAIVQRRLDDGEMSNVRGSALSMVSDVVLVLGET